MSEMLGNYYFLNRNYPEALKELENALRESPENTCVKKRLIVCYTQTQNIDKALDLFHSVIRKNINCIVNTKPDEEDCPCPHLVDVLEKKQDGYGNEYEFFLKLGILWLYYSIERSLHYFSNALQLNQHDFRLPKIIEILTSKIQEQKEGEKNVK